MDINNAAVVTYRGDSVENAHVAHIAVVDADGKLIYSFGNPERMTLARSAAKPAQALSVLETGAFDRFGFDEADLALMCASHSSEERHIARTMSMLSKLNAQEADLQCGGHPPLSDAVYRTWIKHDFTPTAACSNCSGKHVGMLGGSMALGAAIANYHLAGHPMQVHVKQVVASLCDLPENEVEWAVDGCNLPTPAFPLDRLARIYARLAVSADIAAGQDGTPTGRTRALARIYHAMTAYPELIAGEGRYCTVLMDAFKGSLVGKLGADGCYGIGIRQSDQTKRHGTDGAMGISVKVEDGNINVLYMIVSELLDRLQIGTPEQRERLAAFHRPKMLNTRGIETGRAQFQFELKRH